MGWALAQISDGVQSVYIWLLGLAFVLFMREKWSTINLESGGSMNLNKCTLIAGSVLLSLGSGVNAEESATVALTEYGQPDIQGVWFYGTNTPYERPIALGDKQIYTDAEAEELIQALFDADKEKALPLSSDREAPQAGTAIAQEADHNFASARTNLIKIEDKYRTSQITSPANGRLPIKAGGRDIFSKWLAEGHGAFDGPEIRPASERCVGPNGGPMAPMVDWFYNANMQIVQTEDYFVLLAEMNHDARIIPISGQQGIANYPQWMGNSQGHWEGDTLIVETTDFRAEQSWFAFVMSDQLQVTERFKLTSSNEILYTYTFYDPQIYTEAVTVEKTIARRAPGEQVFEYGCHEGNYSIPGILAGARRQEQLN